MPLRALDPESSVSTKFHHPGAGETVAKPALNLSRMAPAAILS